MYENYVINSNASTSTCGCKKDNSSFLKINLQGSCGPEVFTVSNYFSELVHDWEKEAARQNLGICELENITYNTESNQYGDKLTHITFKYRKGHEIIERTFECAPLGERGLKGDPGNDGKPGKDGKNITLSLEIDLDYVNSDNSAKAWFTQNDEGVYTLHLQLKKPEIKVDDLSTIISLVDSNISNNYYTKTEVDSTIRGLISRITDLENSVHELQNARYTYSNETV